MKQRGTTFFERVLYAVIVVLIGYAYYGQSFLVGFATGGLVVGHLSYIAGRYAQGYIHPRNIRRSNFATIRGDKGH